MSTLIGTSVERKEAWDKVTGKAKYTADINRQGTLYARIVTSTVAHAKIKNVDVSEAKALDGVKVVITGKDYPVTCGVLLQDRPVIAIDKVRYYGEPVAIVVALSEDKAALAASMVKMEYEELQAVDSITAALSPDAVLVHDDVLSYVAIVDDIYPQQGTNVASSYPVRKGDMEKGWRESEVVVEQSFVLSSSDHVAMETRSVQVEFMADGSVEIMTSSQSPFTVRKLISSTFNIEEGKVHVQVPLVGGGFGGKSTVQLELLAYIASQNVGGRCVRLSNSREQDMATSPGRLGLEAKVKFGATKNGVIKAAQMTFWLDTGAYTDIGPNMSKAIAVDAPGPYKVDNLWCDSICVYTNHNYATAYRGFSHESYTFCVERTLDVLAMQCGMDPLELRLKNVIKPNDQSPTQVKITQSNTGNVGACLQKLREIIGWNDEKMVDIGDGKIRAKGISCLWKTCNPPTNASGAAVITFNSDGSINLNTGVVEMGSGGQTQLAQMLAEKLKMDFDRVHVKLSVDTQLNPEYWKTVASMTSYVAGRAVMKAASDLITQLKRMASVVLRCPEEDLEVADERVYLRQDPQIYVEFKDIAFGYKYPNGNAVGEQIVGRGGFVLNHLTSLDPQNGSGKTGPSWTVGAQAVEVELDTRDYTYRIIRATTVMDVGKVIDPHATECMIRGGMSMGLSLASREAYFYDSRCVNHTTSLRSYKVMHIGQEPEYLVEFVETPQEDSPYGCRVFSEHGIIGMPAALGNAMALAANTAINQLPITPESIWRSCTTCN